MDLLRFAPFSIDFAYDAPRAGVPVGCGYNGRPAAVPLRGIIWHSTNGVPGSPFDAEAAFLRDSRAVKAHYLVGKDGRITRLLDPGPWQAYHAGPSRYAGWTDLNACTVGVECHHAVGEGWPPAQLAAVAWLCRQLIADHPTIRFLAAHRAVALPAGRKSDPSDLSDSFLAGFVAAL